MHYVPEPKPVEYYWVIDGLPVPMVSGPLTGGPPKPTSCVATQIYISAAGSKTDLSGLKVVEGRPQASKLINQALGLISSDPPLRFVDQIYEKEPLLSLKTCFRQVMGQCDNIIRQPCMGDTMGAFFRESQMRHVRAVAEPRIGSLGSAKPKSGFWSEIRQAFRKEMP